MTLELSDRALTDLNDVLDWLEANAGPQVAADYSEKFDELFDLLANFPSLGTRKPRFWVTVRMSVVTPYLVFYRHVNTHVFNLRILDGRRRITPRLVREPG
jgi:plasmid stabilization system protein ParE